MFRKQKDLKKSNVAVVLNRVGSLIAVIGFALFISLSPLLVNFGPNPTGIYRETVGAQPNYSVTWNDNQPGQYPLRLKSPWFKAYTTKDGTRTATNNTVPITREQASSAPVNPNTLLFVSIRGNAFQSNRECEVQLKVSRPIQGESAIIVDALKPAETEDLPACSDALIRAMAKVVEPDGDNTGQGPERDSDPNTDTEEEATQDRENVAEAERRANGEGDNAPSCSEGVGISASWLVCLVVETLSSSMDKMLSYVDDMLNVDALKLNDSDALRTVWSYFRAIATFALFAVGLVMVISQAIGGGS